MSALERAVAFTLRHEGGYVNNPKDPGGETNWGISKRAYPDLDIANLTREDAVEIYRRDYWAPAQCDKMPEPVAIAHFDCAVHSGVKRAIQILQLVVGAERDGAIGLETFQRLDTALARHGRLGVARKLVTARVRFLVGLERSYQRWTFLEGWMARCVELAGEVSQSAGAAALPPQKTPPPVPGSSNERHGV